MAAFFSIVTDPKKTRQARALYPPTLSTSGPSQRPELSLETPWKRAVPFPRRDGKGTPTLELPAPCLLRNPPTSPVSPQSPTTAWSEQSSGYDTPPTSPETSPVRPKACHLPHSTACIPQLDGPHGSLVENGSIEDPFRESWTARRVSTASLSPPPLRRNPFVLHGHCERNAPSRQRQLTTPDRFIPSRSGTPSKERHALSTSPSKRRSRAQDSSIDPFSPSIRRNLRAAERYTALTPPLSPTRASGLAASRIPLSDTLSRRAISTGSVWNVGGVAVTEGVASITNGRGGRVTSGTTAPHYAADFLRPNEPGDEASAHERRLALAMNIDLTGRIVDSGSSTPTSPTSPAGSPVWKDCKWVEEKTLSPMKKRVKAHKTLPTIPFRVLDAPALRDDFYCSLLAYSNTSNYLAVGLGPHVYLWSETRGVNTPDSLTAPFAAHVTALSFSSTVGGKAILAIGRANGRITLWSPFDPDPRFDSEQPAPVSHVCFRPNTVNRSSMRDQQAIVATEELLVGDEVGNVYFYSVEWPNQDERDLFDWHGSMTLLARISCHTQQICGLAWSPDGDIFATGGNDNALFLFETKKILAPASAPTNTGAAVKVRNSTAAAQTEVINVLPGQHRQSFTLNAAVKAMAFAPWQPTLLAAGGGSNDRCIHFYHTLSGATLATIDCHAQVTSLIWSTQRREIAATFGFAQPEHPYRVAVFAWPGCGMVVGIPWWGEERALYAVAYPGGPNAGGEQRLASEIGRADSEGRAWYGRRTREEGCLVIATSDASIKFHEIWSEAPGGSRVGGAGSGCGAVSGVLGGSDLLESLCGVEKEGRIIR